MRKPICDFCSVQDVKWSYPAENCVLPRIAAAGTRVGAWAACDPCHELIERGDKVGLARRTAEGFDHPSFPRTHNAMASMALEVHEMFYKARCGPPTPYYGEN